MTQKPREHLKLSCTCRNDVGTNIDPSAMASPYFSGNRKNSTSECCNLEMKPMWTPNYQVCIYILTQPNLCILGQNSALLIPATKHDSYQLEIFTEDCGYFFDGPIVKEGIVLRFVSGSFQKIRKKSTEEIFPEYPEIYLISKSIRPNKYHFISHVGPRRNM